MNKSLVETPGIEITDGIRQRCIIIWHVDRYSFLDGGLTRNNTIHIKHM